MRRFNLMLLLFVKVFFIHAAFSVLSSKDIEFIENHESWNMLSINCGHRRTTTRITNGKVANYGQFPWFVRLAQVNYLGQKVFVCGGSLINQDYGITAAHCIVGNEKSLKIARVGEPQTEPSNREHFEDILIKNFTIHPDYDKITLKHDIALIALEHSVIFTPFIQPICLPKGEILSMDLVSLQTTVAGWGVTDSSTKVFANNLLYIDIPIRDICLCSMLYKYKNLNNSQLCVGNFAGEDSCDGDSGGPLMKMINIDGHRKMYLLGLVSFGFSYCGESPAIYTNIVYYMKWILNALQEQNTNDNGRRPKPVSLDSHQEICKYVNFTKEWNLRLTGRILNAFVNCE